MAEYHNPLRLSSSNYSPKSGIMYGQVALVLSVVACVSAQLSHHHPTLGYSIQTTHHHVPVHHEHKVVAVKHEPVHHHIVNLHHAGGSIGGSSGGSSGGSGGDGHHHVIYDYYAEPKYHFKYGVEDPHTHDIKQHEEERNGDKVKGSYSLKEADGTIRVVHYTADKHTGFNAIVERKGHAVHPQGHKYHH